MVGNKTTRPSGIEMEELPLMRMRRRRKASRGDSLSALVSSPSSGATVRAVGMRFLMLCRNDMRAVGVTIAAVIAGCGELLLRAGFAALRPTGDSVQRRVCSRCGARRRSRGREDGADSSGPLGRPWPEWCRAACERFLGGPNERLESRWNLRRRHGLARRMQRGGSRARERDGERRRGFGGVGVAGEVVFDGKVIGGEGGLSAAGGQEEQSETLLLLLDDRDSRQHQGARVALQENRFLGDAAAQD